MNCHRDSPSSSSPSPNSKKRRRLNDNTTTNEDDLLLIKKNIIPPDVLYRLKDFSLFKDAPNSFFLQLSKILNLVQYRPQEYIVKFGEPSKSMYWILRGTVRVTSTDGESTYAELAAGSFFGEIGILFNRPRTATVVARTKVLLGVLTKDNLNIVLSNYPNIKRIITHEAQQRLSMQEKRKNLLLKMSLPTISRKVSIVTNPISDHDHNIDHTDPMLINSSLVANHNDIVPGPSLPPASFIPSTSSSSSNLPCLNDDINNLKFSNIDTIDQSISIREFLYNLPIFSTLPDNIIHNIALSLDLVHYRPMNYIFKEGDLGRDIYFIVYGEIEVIKNFKTIARLYPQMYFGEFSFLSKLKNNIETTRSADIRTISDCEILIIKAKTLDLLCEKYPNIFNEFKKTASERESYNLSEIIENKVSSINELPSCNDSDPSVSSSISPISSVSTTPTLFKNINFNNSKNINTNNNSNNNTYDNSNNYNNQDNFNHDIINLKSVDPTTPIIQMNRSQSQTFDGDNNNNIINNINNNSDNNNNTSKFNKPISMFKSFSFNNEPNNETLLTSISSNPKYGSIQNFSNYQKSNFTYVPLQFRRRLSQINNNRRRKSSILNIGPFPDSIFLKIFQMLDLKNLIKCSTVCIRWKQIIYLSSNLFKILDLKPYCKEIDDQNLYSITKLVGSRPELIDISNCYHITDEGFSNLINEISIRGNIKELIMKNNWNLSSMSIIDLSLSCKSLIKLDLSNCRKIKDDVIIRLIGFKNNYSFGCHNLKDLNLGYCKYLTDKSMQHIIENSNNRLESLDLTRCTTITDLGFLSLNNFKLIKLKRLILKDCTFLSDKVIELISMSCINLEILDLTFCCMLTDNSLNFLSFGCKKLITLNLSFCGSAVSDYSIINLKNLNFLKFLSIKGCIRITREGVDMILTKCLNLIELNILQCSRINYYRGVLVDKFNKLNGLNYCCLKIKPNGRIVKVIV